MTSKPSSPPVATPDLGIVKSPAIENAASQRDSTLDTDGLGSGIVRGPSYGSSLRSVGSDSPRSDATGDGQPTPHTGRHFPQPSMVNLDPNLSTPAVFVTHSRQLRC
jgi:hypothetical protein